MKNRLFVLVAALVMLIPSIAFAIDMELYTYGGYAAVVQALTNLALIFSDNSYLALYGMSLIMGIVFGGAALYSKIVSGANVHPLSYVPSIVIGVCVYTAFVVPKGTLHIWDSVYNRDVAVANIPDGIVILAGGLNLIERKAIDLVDTAAGSAVNATQAGGVGWLGLYNASSRAKSTGKPWIDANLNRYIADCVSFELTLPNSTLTVQELRGNDSGAPQTNFITSLAKAANPAIDTLVYTATDSMGSAISCADAWDVGGVGLKTDLNNKTNFTVMDTMAKKETGFGGVGFTGGGADPYSSTLMDAMTLSGLTPGSVSDSKELMRQMYISNSLDTFLKQGNTTAVTNYQFMQNATGSMVAANSWLPYLRAGLMAITIGMVPFVALFIPTPLMGRAVGLICGLFIWNTVWGVADVVVQSFAFQFAEKTFEAVRAGSLGMDGIYFMPTQSVKMLSIFGMLRMSGMALATIITGMLVKFGGSAMAHMAGGISGSMQSTGASGAAMTENPAGSASAIKANVDASPTRAWANNHGFEARAGQTYAQMAGATQAHSIMSDNFGGLSGVTDMHKKGAVSKAVSYGASGDAMLKHPGGLGAAYAAKTFGAEADLHKSGALADVVRGYGGGVAEYAKTTVAQDQAIQSVFGSSGNYQDFVTANMTKSAGQTAGELSAYASAQQHGFDGSYMDFQAFRSEMSALGDYASADAVSQVASGYGVEPVEAMQMNAQFQAAKHQAESNLATNEFGTSIGGGTQFGIFAATGTAGQIEGVYAAGGMDQYKSMMASGQEGQIARNSLVRQAADKMVNDGQILQGIKNDPDYHQNGHLTEAGFALAQKAMQGQNINFSTPDGSKTLNLDANGSVVNSSSRGTFAPGDQDSRSQAMQTARDISKTNPNAAAQIRSMVKSNTPFSYSTENDKSGKVASFAFTQGGEASKVDNSNTEQLKKSSVGTKAWSGTQKINEDTSVSYENKFAQVDKTVSSPQEAQRINNMLSASGSSVRVSEGDSVMMRMGPDVAANRSSDGSLSSHGPQGSRPTISSFQVKRGGEKDFKDFTHDIVGSYRQNYMNRKETMMGVDLQGADSALVRDVAGEKAAEVAFGTLNGASNVVGKVKTLLPSGGGVKRNPSAPPGSSTVPATPTAANRGGFMNRVDPIRPGSVDPSTGSATTRFGKTVRVQYPSSTGAPTPTLNNGGTPNIPSVNMGAVNSGHGRDPMIFGGGS